MKPKEQHQDRPRDEIMAMAERLLERSSHNARVHFKYTCQHCHERCSFSEPNILYESGECHKCGKVTDIQEAGFMLVLNMKGREVT